MKIAFWGTAAAEGIPGIFCNCAQCQQARERGGRHIRTRSQLLFDDRLLMDFHADTYGHSLKYNFNLANLKNVVITHVHEDHYYPADFAQRRKGYAHAMAQETLTVYGSQDVREYAEKELSAIGQSLQEIIDEKRIAFGVFAPYETKQIDGFEVTAIPATHGTPHPYIYSFYKDGKRALIFNDSGFLSDEANEFLKNSGWKFDFVSYDCTWGKEPAGAVALRSHLGVPDIVAQREIFIKNGNYKPDTVDVITHFSHNIKGCGYDDMLPVAKEHGFILAYDGMVIDI